MRFLITLLIIAGCLFQYGCTWLRPAPKPLEQVSAAGVTVEDLPVGSMVLDGVKTALESLAKQKNAAPQNAGFDGKTGRITPDLPGRTLDVAKTAENVMNAPAGSRLQPVYREAPAPITMEQISKAKKIGGYVTPIIDKQPDRLHNIKLTANLLNNTVLESGQEFSFNRLTGEPTSERGFREAVILEGGRRIRGMGGGMCQVSSTIYNAVLEADLPVFERHPHSLPVQYVPPGRDATTFTDKDFRFINTTRHVVMLRVLSDNAAVTADLWELAPE